MNIARILDPLGHLLKRRRILNETREVGTMDELQKLENQAIELKEKGDSRLYDALYTPMEDTKYKYLSSESVIRGETLYSALNHILSRTSTKSFFIKNGDKFIAFIGFFENGDDSRIVDNVKLFNFDVDDENNNTFKDTIELMNVLINSYKEINFFADLDNKEVVEIYKKYSKRHNGFEPVIKDGNIHFKIPGKIRG
jgi:hypothetical protein